MDVVELEGHDGAATAADEIHDREIKANDEAILTAATVGVVAVGAALVETALLPGLILGVAAMWAPKYLPRTTAALGPVFKSSVRGIYKMAQKTKEAFAEAQEHVHDIVAEVDAEGEAVAAKAEHDTMARPAA
jgi:hypothetical protein